MPQYCLCSRVATKKQDGYEWMCTFHYNRLIKKLRIERKKARAEYKKTQLKKEANRC